ncbi:MAG: hypothetical protein ACRELC_00410, partial [Gemmatimonadota bacterium]
MAPGLFKQDSPTTPDARDRSGTNPAAPRGPDRSARLRSSGGEESLSVLGPGLTITGDVKARGTV